MSNTHDKLASKLTVPSDEYVLVKVKQPESSEKKESLVETKTSSPTKSTTSTGVAATVLTSLLKNDGFSKAAAANGGVKALVAASNMGLHMSSLLKKDSYEFRLVRLDNWFTDVAGTMTGSIPMDPSTFAEFSDLSTFFDEFRVKEIKVSWHGFNRYSKVTAESRPVFFCYDNDDANAPATQLEVYQYPNCSIGNVDDIHTVSHRRPNLTPSAYWVDMASPSGSTGAVKFIMTSNTVSTLYGLTASEILIECRGRR